MTRLLILATFILSIVSYASAQFVATLNTPIGPVTQGAKVSVTWTLAAGANPGAALGDLSATDSATKNVIDIDQKVPLAPENYLWNVQVPPGTYTLGLNDGSGLKQSGEVIVKAPAGGATTPAGGAAPAPPAGGAAPAGGATPAGGAPPAGGAAPAPATGNTPTAGEVSSPAPAPPAAISTPTTPSVPSSAAGASATTPPAISTGSASSIFPGYEVILSLLSVAVAMSQF